jgi:hypothetical protein
MVVVVLMMAKFNDLVDKMQRLVAEIIQTRGERDCCAYLAIICSISIPSIQKINKTDQLIMLQ